MRLTITGFVAALAMAAGGLAGCGGGGGHGFSVGASEITITSTALPPTLSGQIVNHLIPYTGGTGGPYLLDVIDGALPSGISTNAAVVGLTGRALVDGHFQFTLRLTDTGSQPFTVSIKSFDWVIGIGSLVIATDAVLPSMLYNQYASIPLTVAGGVPPYACEIVDDPANLNDEPPPNGITIPTDSCTFSGAPIGSKLPVIPPWTWKVSVKAYDHALIPNFPGRAEVIKEFTLTVIVPDIIIVTGALGNGICGTAYTDKVVVQDGVPPFKHYIVDANGSQTRLRGFAPSLNAVAKNTATSAYGLDNATSPYNNKFPEGIYLRDTTGEIFGTPRRAGIFNNWNYFVISTVFPTLASQQKWKTYAFTMADSAPPALALNPSVLLAGNTFSSPSNFLQDADANKPYSKQFLATGGVPQDGFSDSPSETDRQADGTEVVGAFSWSATLTGQTFAAIGMTMTSTGQFKGVNASNAVGNLRTGYLTLTPTVVDYQLPVPPILSTHTATGTCQFAVGPDLVIITESTVAATLTTVNSSFAPQGTFNHVSFEYNDQSVYVWEPNASVAMTVRALATTDLCAVHTKPVNPSPLTATAAPPTLATMLANFDHMPVTVNPTWWAYDPYNINPNSARALQHADPQHLNNSDGYNSDSTESYGNSVWYIAINSGAGSGFNTKERDGDSCIELPFANNVPGVAAGNVDLVNGIYANGGQLRAFDGGTYMGFYIVRKDSKIYIPFAINKATFAPAMQGFGDAVLSATRSVASALRRLQISVSPDGRFASAKLKPSLSSFAETSGTEQIVVFSLTGEQVFTQAGLPATFRTMSTGGVGTTVDGLYFYGDSMALTNGNLYFLKGNNLGSGGPLNGNTGVDTVMYGGHFVYKVAILGTTNSPAPALLSPGFGGIGGWTNSNAGAGQPLSVAYHRWCTPGASNLNSPTNNWIPSPGAAPSNFLNVTTPTYVAADVLAYNFGNFAANSAAPGPFRVSANGLAMAVVAADGFNAATRADTFALAADQLRFLQRSVYVDYNNVFREAGVTKRRFFAPTRTAGIRPGEYVNKMQGWYNGPATQMEISDDGTVIADVYNSSAASWANIGQNDFPLAKEDISVLRGTGTAADPWSSRTETIVTPFFTNDIWRFGCLAFTRNTNGPANAGALYYWGGASIYGTTAAAPIGAIQPSFTYNQSNYYSGSIYQYTLSAASSIAVLPFAAGGHPSGVFSVTSGGPTSTIPAANWTSALGSIMPDGYFVSPNGQMLYMECLSPLMDTAANSSGAPIAGNDTTAGRLIAMPVLDTSSTINGNPANRAFALTGWPIDPNAHGFGGMCSQTSNSWTAMSLWNWCGGACNRHAQQTAVTAPNGTNGTLFFNGYFQDTRYSSTSDSSSTWQGGGPTNNVAWSDGGHFAGEIYAFNSNVAGFVQNITNLGGSASSPSRIITYMQPNLTGTKLAFQTTRNSSTSFSHRYATFEQVYAVCNVNFTATGALSTVPTRFTIEGSDGRAGPSMTFDFFDTKLYYAFIAGGANENNMVLREAVINAAGNAVSSSRTQSTGFGGTAARFSVLNSSR
jgi:hypothetical protein